MRAFWDQWQGGRNFGDALTAALFWRLAGIRLVWSEPEEAELFGVGSLAEAIPAGFAGVVFGTGKMFGSSQLDLRNAQALALRGALTAEGSRATCDLLADPGLLAADLAPAVERDIEVGVIAHYIDRRRYDGHAIDVMGGVEHVIAEAARCRAIVSSSLHGLVLADALGVPSRWVHHQRVAGEGFKFRDYASSYGDTIRPDVWRQADPALVTAKRDRLRVALATFSMAEAAA
jgi:pyruvyltransferase